MEPNVKPGEQADFVIRVNNPTSNLIENNVYAKDFRSNGETGQPSFYTSTDENDKYAISKWITFNQSKIALAPGQIVEFKFTLSVPKDAEPGGHYGAVFFADAPPDIESGTSQVALSSMIGTLILAKVPGDVVESGLVQDFTSDQFLYLKNKVALDLRLTNTGNVHFKPSGEILIKNIFGSVVEQVSLNKENGNVLPSSTRKFSTNWDSKKFLFGRFTAEAKILYGDNKTLSSKTSFWIIPLWAIIVLFSLIVIIVVLIILSITRKKRKNKVKSRLK